MIDIPDQPVAPAGAAAASVPPLSAAPGEGAPPSGGSDAPAPSVTPALESAPEAKDEIARYKAGWQRALADYQNLQKEVGRQRAEWAALSEQMILEEFIPVYDNFRLAFRLQTPDFSPAQQPWVNGIKYIMKQFSDILKAHGIEEIKTVGEEFDPGRHESVGEEPANGQEAGVVVREVEGGYIMAGRVIKVAKVIVAK